MFIKFWHIIVMQAVGGELNHGGDAVKSRLKIPRHFFTIRDKGKGKFMLITFHHFYDSRRFWF